MKRLAALCVGLVFGFVLAARPSFGGGAINSTSSPSSANNFTATGVTAAGIDAGVIKADYVLANYVDAGTLITSTIKSTTADAVSAVGVVTDTITTLAAASTMSLSVRNGGVQRFGVDKTGNVVLADGQLGLSGNAGATKGLFSTGSNLFIKNATGNPIILEDAAGTGYGYFDSNGLRQAGLTGTGGSGTGITINFFARVRTFVHKITVTEAALTDADTEQDVVLWTVPARTQIKRVILDCTANFTGGTVSALTVSVGPAGAETTYLVATSCFSGTPVVGDAEAELGTALVGGIEHIPSWTGTTAIEARFTSTDDNLVNLTAGSAAFYIEGMTYP